MERNYEIGCKISFREILSHRSRGLLGSRKFYVKSVTPEWAAIMNTT